MAPRAESTPTVEAVRVIDGQDALGRAVALDIKIGERVYPSSVYLFLDYRRGWRRILGRYGKPELYLVDDRLRDRCDRDIDLLQVVAGTVLVAAA